MPEDLDQPPRGYTTADVPTQGIEPRHSRWRSRLKIALVVIIVTPVLLFALYTWSALHFSYGKGERVGYVQKFAREGWLCKTWEGELAMVNLPGAMPQIFHFTVRDGAVARQITQDMDHRVSLGFEEHRGVPTSCFGDTEYYVTSVQVAGR